ncbi:MAG: methyltransferase domain-containing protein [Alphaproteobacteria bacterium]|jgi:ubiquinone/menaquinone biosynthesis C-methylase UbiE|nr:methyltransferase domain-containing protein [Alphaproteobacteria bacterium]
MVSAVDAFVYGAAQVARIAWFQSQARLTARLSRGSFPKPKTPVSVPKETAVLREVLELLRRDWDNIRAGLYRMPHDLVPPPQRAVGDILRFLEDLPQVTDRRRTGRNDDVFRKPPPGTEALPRYFRQNFHFQTDGYLSVRSARLYDYQVEVLFRGAADAMRRQALPYLATFIERTAASGRRPQDLHLLDVGSGTGHFLSFVKDTWPLLPVTALDLSAPYLGEARNRLARWSGLAFVQAPAEAMPLPDASVDLVTCIYLFHELPRKIRAAAAAEMARVLKPGGRLVFVDSIQRGDRPDFDGILAYFPQAYYEPYYADYVAQDLVTLFERTGLLLGALDLAFMSKVLVFEKPCDTP